MHKIHPAYQLFQNSFYEYYKPLCKYAYTFVKDSDTIEDIVQEILMKVWEKKQDLLGKNELRFYLFTAVKNNCLTYLEKKKKLIITGLTGNEKTGNNVEYPFETNVDIDFSLLLEEAFERLPPKCREVFLLSRISKQTYQQIADTSGISIKTVENQMGKALSIMRAFIREKQSSLINWLLFFYFLANCQ
ncbi:MAG: RNA polymerase sigma-70 factor [Ferruginibacter sp.]